jgi:hypothetical protein
LTQALSDITSLGKIKDHKEAEVETENYIK